MLKQHNSASLEACYRARFDTAASVVPFDVAKRNCMHSVAAYAPSCAHALRSPSAALR